MKLYGALLSPFVRKVAVAAAEKGLSYELARADPGVDDPAFRAASPFGKIPAINDDGFMLCDSSAIVAYLDARQPDSPLFPADPRARGRAVWFDEFADTIYGGSGLKVLFHRLVGPRLLKRPFDENVALRGEQELPPILAYLEDAMPGDGWLVGPFSVGDIAVASMLRTMTYVGHGPDPAAYPRTAAWYERVRARPAWRRVAEQEAPLSRRLGID